jgi:hypothetical protein
VGTNYYVEREPCAHCGVAPKPVHIGKSSAGWCFSLHVDDERTSLADWIAEWSKPGAQIVDEYGQPTAPEKMLSVITDRAWKPSGHFDYQRNHAEPGPNGLARHTIGRHCIGHGDGTYDLIPGEFS